MNISQESRNTGTELRYGPSVREVIGAAIAVHTELGPGFLESVYEQVLAVEFAIGGIAFVRQKPIPWFYRDHQIGEHRLDFSCGRKNRCRTQNEGNARKCPFRYRPQLLEGSWLGGWSAPKLFVDAGKRVTGPPGADLGQTQSTILKKFPAILLS